MLEIRPNCEYCDKDLLPDATDACICTYECTFCRDCVDNVCPNCGGGFTARPIRPKTAHRDGLSLQYQHRLPKYELQLNIRLSEIIDFRERVLKSTKN